jgi:hypothetical protein
MEGRMPERGSVLRRMRNRRTVVGFLTIIGACVIPNVDAFVAEVYIPSKNHCIAFSPKEVTSKLDQLSTSYNKHERTREKSVLYNLGIGRNTPVNQKKKSGYLPRISRRTDTHEACRYLIDHEAVNSITQCQKQLAQNPEHAVAEHSTFTPAKIQGQKNIKQGKTKHGIHYRRGSEDVLVIRERHPDETVYHPTTVRRLTSDKLDVNTVWVEMMVHSEQMKTCQEIAMGACK